MSRGGPTRSLHLAALVAALAVTTPQAQSAGGTPAKPPGIVVAGQPGQLEVRQAGAHSLRVTLRPASLAKGMPPTPVLAERTYPEPTLRVRELATPLRRRVGSFRVEVRPNPLTVIVTTAAGRRVQHLIFEADGSLSFALDADPVLGMGEGGPRPERGQAVARAAGAVRSPRRARHDGAALAERHVRLAQPGRDAVRHRRLGPVRRDALGARRPARADRGVFLPWKPAAADQRAADRRQSAAESRQGPAAGRQRSCPASTTCSSSTRAIPRRPSGTSPPSPAPPRMPPKWALGYMQSHRTLEDDTQMLGIVDTFRAEAHSARRGHLSRHRLHAARLEHEAAVVRFQSRGLQARSAGRARRHARAAREGRGAHGAVGSRPAADAARAPFRRARAKSVDASHIAALLAAARAAGDARRRRLLARRGRLVQSVRAHQAAPALLPGASVDAARTCGPGACSATAIPASRSGAAGCGRAIPSRRGRRSRRRLPSASTTRSASGRTGDRTSAASIRTAS